MIRAIIFDFGGVINKIGSFKVTLDKISYKTEGEYKDFINYSKDSFFKSHLYEVDDFYNDVREYYKVNLTNDEICDLVIEPNLEVINCLKKLSKEFEIFILTAITKGLMERFQKKINLNMYVNEIFEICKEHLSKKDPRLIKRIIKKIGLKSDEILYIDDSQVNLDVAKKLNVDIILFNDITKLKKELIRRNLKF